MVSLLVARYTVTDRGEAQHMYRQLVVKVQTIGWPRIGMVITLRLPDPGPDVRDVMAGAFRAGVADTAAADQLAERRDQH